MEPWTNKLLRDSTLHDYTQSIMLTQHWSREQVNIEEYFGSAPYTVTEELAGTYKHNLSQFVHKKFFEEVKGFKKISESNMSSNGVAAVMEDIPCDLNETFRAYSHAAIGYEDQGGLKVLVMIDREDENEIKYKIAADPIHASLLKEWFDYSAKNNMYRGKKITAACRFLDLKEVTWADVILPAQTIALLQSLITMSMETRRIYKKNKLSQKRGILLEGEPGNGKTSAIKVIVKEIPAGTSVIMAQPSHLKHSGDVRSLCQMARDLAPSIMIIEDLDWIAEDRSHSGDAGKVIELMNQMDGVEEMDGVITIGTTNDVEKIEKAIKNRPGRFDRVIKIPNPDEDCRKRMILHFTKHWHLDKSVEVEKLVGFTDKLSGAHMGDLCLTAAHKAVMDSSWDADEKLIVKNEHFLAAVKEVKNKNYSSYLKVKGQEKGPMGFNTPRGFDYEDI